METKRTFIPGHVKIGHFSWTVKGVESFDSDGTWGECDHEALEIRIKESLPEPHLTATFVHELMHAMLAHCGIMEHDEQHINALSIRLVEVLRDNPDVVRAIVNDHI
ncbi:MAG: ImmA/IrrE family metallo-endopeptidase [Chloroflexota bacterium]